MAPTPGPFGPTKSLIQLSDGPTGSASYGTHAVLHDVLHEDRKFKIQTVAGPDVTDQIGASVHNSSMEGMDAFPDNNRHITGYKTPASFVPQYGVSTTKDSADVAAEERAALAKVKHAEEAKKAAEEEEIQAAREKETVKALAEKKEKLLAKEAKTVVEKEQQAKDLAKLEAEQADVDKMVKDREEKANPDDGVQGEEKK